MGGACPRQVRIRGDTRQAREATHAVHLARQGDRECLAIGKPGLSGDSIRAGFLDRVELRRTCAHADGQRCPKTEARKACVRGIHGLVDSGRSRRWVARVLPADFGNLACFLRLRETQLPVDVAISMG